MLDPFTSAGSKALLKRAKDAGSGRASEDRTFQRLARIFRPAQAYFTTKRSPGDDQFQNLYDSTPQEAAGNLASGLFGSTMNPANRWFELRAPIALRGDSAVVRYMAAATDAMVETLTPSVSGFYAEAPVFLTDLACYGTAVFYSEYRPEKSKWLDKSVALHGVWIDADVDGEIRTHYCKRDMTAEQILGEYPEPVDALPDAIAKANNPDAKFAVWMISLPNPKITAATGDARERRFLSLHILEQTNGKGEPVVLRRKGDDTAAWMTGRWERRNDSPYGHGRGHVALADALSLQVARKSLLEAGAWAARPPILAAEERNLRRARIQPAAIVYGGISRGGQPMARAMETGQRMPFASEMTEQLREAVKQAFYFYVMQMQGRSGMSATEVAEWSEQKWRLMGPAMATLQGEFLAVFLQRRWRVMRREGLLPTGMPGALEEMFAPVVDFVSPMAMAQRSADGVAAMRFSEAILKHAEVKPEMADWIDDDRMAQEYQETLGARPYLLRSKDQVKKIRERREQGQARQQAIEAAPAVGGALKDIAAAGAANDDASLAGLGQTAG